MPGMGPEPYIIQTAAQVEADRERAGLGLCALAIAAIAVN